MPFISFTTNQKFSLRQENEIVKRTGELITILPGKKEENLMPVFRSSHHESLEVYKVVI